MELGFGFQPAKFAVSVWPTTAEPVIVGAGAAVKGRPAVINEVVLESTTVLRYPGLDADARTKICFPESVLFIV